MAISNKSIPAVRVAPKQRTDTGVTLRSGVGRGLPLIADGKPAHLGCRTYSATPSAISSRPRTFVGWDANGRWRTFTVPGMNISGMAMDGDTLVIADEGGVVKRVNSATGTVLGSANIPEAATAVAVIGTTCRPDMNDDGQLNVADLQHPSTRLVQRDTAQQHVGAA